MKRKKKNIQAMAAAIVNDTNMKLKKLVDEEQALDEKFKAYGFKLVREYITKLRKLSDKKITDALIYTTVDGLSHSIENGTSLMLNIGYLINGSSGCEYINSPEYRKLIDLKNELTAKRETIRYFQYNGGTLRLDRYDEVLRYLIDADEKNEAKNEAKTAPSTVDETVLKEAMELLNKSTN